MSKHKQSLNEEKMYNTFKTIDNAIKHWYFPLIAGILFIAVGIWAIITPVATYLSLSILFSLTIFFTGILEIVFSITYKKIIDGWGWLLTSGILSLIIGVLLIVHPQISIVTLPIFIGFVVLYHSIMAIGWSIELKKYKVSLWGWLLATGIAGVFFSFILLWDPFFAGLTVAVLTGIGLITIGIFHIHFSIEVKKLNNTIKKLKN